MITKTEAQALWVFFEDETNMWDLLGVRLESQGYSEAAKEAYENACTHDALATRFFGLATGPWWRRVFAKVWSR